MKSQYSYRGLLMKLSVLIFFLGISRLFAQFDVEIQKSAWERTSYEHWDEFDPFYYFELIHPKYDDEDRRTMHTRAKQMALWSIYKDDFEFYQKKTDSLFENETYKAMDRVLNKNWLLVQRGQARGINRNLDAVMLEAASSLPSEIFNALDSQIVELRENIDICLDSYVDDAKKSPLIEKYLESLASLLGAAKALHEFYKIYTIIEETIEPIEIESIEIEPIN